MEKTIFDANYRAIVGQLKAARIRHGLTQVEVGHQIGKCRSWLNKIETFEIRLDVLCFVRLCRVLGLASSRLIQQMENGVQGE